MPAKSEEASLTVMARFVECRRDVTIKEYFSFMDSLASATDSVNRDYCKGKIDEYLIVLANPWVLDTLRATDYYARKARGIFQQDQTTEKILRRGDRLVIPDSVQSANIRAALSATWIDLNIPEFKLHLMRGSDTILTCPVRVGRNAIQYLELAHHDVNLRTPTGNGKIVRIARIPYQINPENGKLYEGTTRDDGKYTAMPIIPWLEPEINGIRYGTLIHPTTNPNTLGKAFSHGCVGTSEADAWTIYYNCPVGTRVRFRYDLDVLNKEGDTIRLRDIYKIAPKKLPRPKTD